MGILDRMSRLVRANINDLIDRAEDPEKMIDQIIRDMQANITDARRQVAAMIAQEKELEADVKENAALSAEWGTKAQRAVGAGKDELAREALRRKRDSDENLEVYRHQFTVQKETVTKLRTQLNALESKYQQTVSQRDSLIARKKRADATKRVVTSSSAAVASLSGLDASSELDRMEAKIRQSESEALAYQELDSGSYDAQFRELDYDVDIEQQLDALKSGGSLESLPSGDDPFAELESLPSGDEAPAESGSSGTSSSSTPSQG
ncbi:MAG TPA: PspA/IM30 family protein [Thermomicrobiales bacterium]|nr:PspA/IM30 family protein [Thermomicrobiales bacterium]